jgi:Na+-transporting methylmalonyl-CoA/oxaloacetate decarboxylase gamma subunit
VQALIFFSGLGGLVVLVWLLALISMAVSNDISDEAAEAEQKDDTAAELQDNPSHKGFAAIYDAINSYRRSRETQNRQQDKREKITVILVGATAVFAFFAVIAAIVSAFIFQGQLRAMESDQRPWVGAPVKIEPRVANGEIDFLQTFRNVGHRPHEGTLHR